MSYNTGLVTAALSGGLNISKNYDINGTTKIYETLQTEIQRGNLNEFVKAAQIKIFKINSFTKPYLLRITFDLRRGSTSYAVSGRIYKNGVAVGTVRTAAATTYTTFTEDISFNDGDTIELWMSRADVTTGWARNFGIIGSIIDDTSTSFLLQTDEV